MEEEEHIRLDSKILNFFCFIKDITLCKSEEIVMP